MSSVDMHASWGPFPYAAPGGLVRSEGVLFRWHKNSCFAAWKTSVYRWFHVRSTHVNVCAPATWVKIISLTLLSEATNSWLDYITCHLADAFIQSNLQLIRLSRRHTPWSNVGLRALLRGPTAVQILSWPHQESNHRPCGSKSSSLTTTLPAAPLVRSVSLVTMRQACLWCPDAVENSTSVQASGARRQEKGIGTAKDRRRRRWVSRLSWVLPLWEVLQLYRGWYCERNWSFLWNA